MHLKIGSFFLFLCILFPLQAHAAKRVALVIGNASYAASPLKNPANDAVDMAKLLKKLGFEVIRETNANKREMLKAINRFSSKLKKSEVGLFYYAGHGMQINNRNYLIPVGVNVLEEDDVEYEAVDAGRIISKMKSAENKLNVVILDACRNNPFARSFRSSTQGLARMDAPKGTIISYATSPGAVAADGRGRNGIFTKHLLHAMTASDLDLQDVFNEAGMQVMQETGDRQIPWTSNTPIPRFYLAGGVSVLEAGSQRPKVRKDVGSLKVKSIPSGAKVFIDDKRAGETPVELGDMKPGNKRVRVEKSGYTSEEKSVRIRAGGRKVIRFDLEQEVTKAWLTVSASPSGARIRILNISPRYSAGMALAPGRYHVEVSSNGYQSEQQWIELDAGDDLDVDISLKKEKLKSVASIARPQSTSSSRSFTDATTGMKFVWVPGGCFQMGDTFGKSASDEKPVHEVCVDGFYMGKYEVTQEEYQKIIGSNPSRFKKGNTYPVERVSWNDTQTFIQKLNGRSGKNFRLPTEAEWEYAASSGSKKEKYAGSNSPSSVAWYGDNSGNSSHQVGTKSPNGLGLYDMSGNLREWCSDWYGKNYYASSPRNNPQGLSSGSRRVDRGGSWIDRPANVRVTTRYRFRVADHSGFLGFRLVSPGQ